MMYNDVVHHSDKISVYHGSLWPDVEVLLSVFYYVDVILNFKVVLFYGLVLNIKVVWAGNFPFVGRR